jgi:predicted ATP-grasp superfamily ATP-dependent carboligase
MPINLKQSDKPYAIIIGLDSMQGLQVARILADRDVPVIAVTKSAKYYSSFTRVCEKIVVANTSSEELIEFLVELGPTLKHKAVLYPCQSKNVLLISRYRDALAPWYHIILSAPDTVEMLKDKVQFYTYAKEAGLPIPKTFILNERSDAVEAAAELSFPCILKPPVRLSSWSSHTKEKAFKIESPEELLEKYDHYSQWTESLIAQDWIDGTDADLYSCNCYFNKKSELVTTFVARKLRQWPPQTGQSCLGEECRNDLVLNETIGLFKGVNYCGLGYVEMKRDQRTGKYFIIEPNVGRPTGRSAIAEAGGVELHYAMYCDAVGLPMPANLVQKYKGVKWIHLLRDLQSAMYYWRKGELTFLQWLKSVRGRKAYAIFSWRDPAPFVAAVFEAIRQTVSTEE